PRDPSHARGGRSHRPWRYRCFGVDADGSSSPRTRCRGFGDRTRVSVPPDSNAQAVLVRRDGPRPWIVHRDGHHSQRRCTRGKHPADPEAAARIANERSEQRLTLGGRRRGNPAARARVVAHDVATRHSLTASLIAYAASLSHRIGGLPLELIDERHDDVHHFLILWLGPWPAP